MEIREIHLDTSAIFVMLCSNTLGAFLSQVWMNVRSNMLKF